MLMKTGDVEEKMFDFLVYKFFAPMMMICSAQFTYTVDKTNTMVHYKS